MLATTAVRMTEAELWGCWAGQVAVNQREAPHLVEEMRGIARGAGVSFERIFLLNSLLDLNSLRNFDLAAPFAGCSTFAVVAGTVGARDTTDNMPIRLDRGIVIVAHVDEVGISTNVTRLVDSIFPTVRRRLIQ